MDYRKSHNFNPNVIAANLADFGDHDFSDDESSGSFAHSSEEEVELTELEMESMTAASGVGEKRPSRALEQIMMGMHFDEKKEAPQVVSSDHHDASHTKRKAQKDSHDKTGDTRSKMMHSTKVPSKKAKEKDGHSSWEGKIDDIIQKPAAGMQSPVPRKQQPAIVSPRGTAGGSVRQRRGKRSEMVKSNSARQRGAGAGAVSPGRPRKPSMQHRTPSKSKLSSDEKSDDPIPRGSGHGPSRRRQPRTPSMSHLSDDENPGGEPISRGSGHGPSRRRQPRAPSMNHLSDDENPGGEPIPRGSGHGPSRRRQPRTPSMNHLSDDENPGGEPIPRGSGHGPSRRRQPRTPSMNHLPDEEHPGGEPIPRGSGHGPSRRRQPRTPSMSHLSDEEHPGGEPIPRGSGHGHRRQNAPRPNEHSGDDEQKADDPIPRGSGHGHRRRPAAARRAASGSSNGPTRQPSTARRAKHADPNTAVLSGEGTGLKW
ncbi:unnamed protein product [Cylindrotheca closterium]|uniref:Uncharacterized protein n=1 Tax=Cylindrotheca closterium TaxID=2856 RepID=A0AAD2CRP1_9STRA|nr:unnamed protein product [Cylindrotheca closterium]